MRRPVARRRGVRHHQLAKPIEGWLPLGDAYKGFGRVQAGRPDQRRRSAAALFHLGHDGQAQAGAAQPSQLPGGRAVDHVLARPAAGRRARQHLLAGLGQARLEHLLRAVECRRHGPDGQPGAVQRQGAAGRAGALRRHHLLRAADRVAPADPGGSARPASSRCARSAARASRSIPEVINKVQEAWGLTIRDGYGQTETTAQVANSPGQKVKPGAMGRPMPGYRVLVLDADGMPTDEGEICLDLERRASGRPDAGLRRRLGRSSRAPTTRSIAPATSPASTRTATSPSSAAPTTCSSRRTTASARSSWRAC